MVQQTLEQTSPAASDSTGRANGNPYQFVPAGTGPAYRSPVDQIRFLLTGEQTGGALSWRRYRSRRAVAIPRTFIAARREVLCSKGRSPFKSVGKR